MPQELIVEVNSILDRLKEYDEEIYKHCVRVSYLSRFLAEHAQLSPYDCLVAQFAGLLHDAGKMDVPIEIVNKPAALTDEEYEVVRSHPEKSAALMEPLLSSSFFRDVQMAVLHHHERIDGRGYPFKLSGEEIPYISRLILVVDTFDAMTYDRPYRKGLPMEVAYDELEKHSGTQFDAELADIFIQSFIEFGEDIEREDNIIQLPFLVNAA
ncbi:MAG: HD domain-containing protein [Bdellovibrionales bacterium]|nr:HD domain-containing protein [Bdellovibrionales bacterium]